MRRCFDAGLVKGEHMSVDGSFVQANADHHRRVPREQLAEVADVNRTAREYLVELEQENPVEPPVPQQDEVSTTDPNSTCATKRGGPNQIGLRRLRLRRMRFVREQFYLAAAVQNLKRLVRFLSNKPIAEIATA